MSHYPAPPEFAPGWLAVCRGASLGLGTWMLLNAAERRILNLSDSTTWLCPMAPLDPALIVAVLALGGTALVLFAARPDLPPPIHWLTVAVAFTLAVFLASDVYRIVSPVFAGDVSNRLFRPLSVLVVVGVVLCGLIAQKRRLPPARPPIVRVPLIAVLTVAGLIVASVRGGMAADVIVADSVRAVIIAADDPPADDGSGGTDRRVALAAGLLERHRDIPLFVFDLRPDSERDAQSESWSDAVTGAGVAVDRILLDRAASDAGSTLEAAIMRLDERGNGAGAAAIPGVDLLWLGDPVHFAEIRLLARRRGRSVRCHSGDESAAGASTQSSILPAVVSFCGTLFRPFLTW